MKKFIKYLLFMVLVFIPFNVVKAYIPDASGMISSAVIKKCTDPNNCWIFPDGHEAVKGIRISVVHADGHMISSRTMDYLTNTKNMNILNHNADIYMCNNNARNKISYIKVNSNCDLKKRRDMNDNIIAKYMSPDILLDIFNNPSAAATLKSKITSMNNTELEATIFNDIGYTIPTGKERDNHYIIIEPTTLVKHRGNLYYGTYHELSQQIGSTSRLNPVIFDSLPLAMFITGNQAIKGPAAMTINNHGYFNNSLFSVDPINKYNEYIQYECNTKIKPICSVKNWENIKPRYRGSEQGFGIAIYWLGIGDPTSTPDSPDHPDFPDLDPPKCDFNNSSHFKSTTSGPNGEDCCLYVLDNLDNYGITRDDLYNRHRRCRQNIINDCPFGYNTSQPSCNNSAYGFIKDINDWNCIKASPLSDKSSVQKYFLKYGDFNSPCSIYCRDEVEYTYPGSGMFALAGNYFTIANKSNSYYYYIDDVTKTTKVKAATLGPISITVKRECTIDTDPDTVTSSDLNQCQVKLNEQLDKLKAPEIEFAYESNYYNNPTENLKVSKTTTINSTNGDIKTRSIKYEYTLPTTTYYAVSKGNGASTKYKPSLNNSNYITIGYHLPIHFTQTTGKIEYQIGIKNFNNENFNNAFIKGNKLPTTIKSSIESYIQNLRKSGNANAININGKWYLDKTFVKLLEKANYDTTNFMQMSCANTGSYTCGSDANGIYCLDKNSGSNSEQTYKNLDSCIRTEVQKLKTDSVSYKSDLTYTCNFTVKNTISPTPTPDPSGYKCKYIDGKYYGKNGNIVSKDTYNKECDSSTNPDPCIPGDPTCPDGDDNDDDNCVGPNCNPGGIDPEDGPGGINVIFRPISLDNPFPSIDGDGRKTGSNWCYWYNCDNTNDVVKKAITNNRNVKTEKVYKDLDPLYKITLTPALIKEIRAYNKKTSYDDFNLKCTNGTKCLSDFIRKGAFKDEFKGCGIRNASGGFKCQDFDKWG